MNISYYKNLFREELLKSCVPFWLEHGIDREYGGILNCLDRVGEVYSEDKSVWMQGRAGWMFSYIYNRIEKKQENPRFQTNPTYFFCGFTSILCR